MRVPELLAYCEAAAGTWYTRVSVLLNHSQGAHVDIRINMYMLLPLSIHILLPLSMHMLLPLFYASLEKPAGLLGCRTGQVCRCGAYCIAGGCYLVPTTRDKCASSVPISTSEGRGAGGAQDPHKFARAQELLRMNEEIKEARKVRTKGSSFMDDMHMLCCGSWQVQQRGMITTRG